MVFFPIFEGLCESGFVSLRGVATSLFVAFTPLDGPACGAEPNSTDSALIFLFGVLRGETKAALVEFLVVLLQILFTGTETFGVEAGNDPGGFGLEGSATVGSLRGSLSLETDFFGGGPQEILKISKVKEKYLQNLITPSRWAPDVEDRISLK